MKQCDKSSKYYIRYAIIINITAAIIIIITTIIANIKKTCNKMYKAMDEESDNWFY
jgi:hypothetical protein